MNKAKINELIKADKQNYSGKNFVVNIYHILTHHQLRYYMKNIILARKVRYYRENRKGLNILRSLYYERKYNILSQKSNISIRGKFGKNLKVRHENIIINKYAELGDNVILHGNNCIGNRNNGTKDCPKIGNNVDIGYGVSIIGGITIADDIIIGANSLVNKSFLEKGIIIAGTPAKKIGERKDINK